MSSGPKSAHKYVQFVDNKYGGRLKYFGEEASSSFWDRAAAADSQVTYHREINGHLPYALRRAFIGRIASGSRVLEAGSGLGHFTIAMHSLGYDATGIDYAPEVVSRLKVQFPNIDFRFGDVTRLVDFGDETVDAIYSPGVSEHFETGPHSILQESYRVLRHGGLFVNSSPCFSALRRLRAKMGQYPTEPPLGLPFYQWAYTQREYTAILESEGYSVLDVIGKSAMIVVDDMLPERLQIPQGKVRHVVAAALDRSPLGKPMSHSCLWVARKR